MNVFHLMFYLLYLKMTISAFWNYPMAKPGRRSLLVSEKKPPSAFSEISFRTEIEEDSENGIDIYENQNNETQTTQLGNPLFPNVPSSQLRMSTSDFETNDYSQKISSLAQYDNRDKHNYRIST